MKSVLALLGALTAASSAYGSVTFTHCVQYFGNEQGQMVQAITDPVMFTATTEGVQISSIRFHGFQAVLASKGSQVSDLKDRSNFMSEDKTVTKSTTAYTARLEGQLKAAAYISTSDVGAASLPNGAKTLVVMCDIAE